MIGLAIYFILKVAAFKYVILTVFPQYSADSTWLAICICWITWDMGQGSVDFKIENNKITNNKG